MLLCTSRAVRVYFHSNGVEVFRRLTPPPAAHFELTWEVQGVSPFALPESMRFKVSGATELIDVHWAHNDTSHQKIRLESSEEVKLQQTSLQRQLESAATQPRGSGAACRMLPTTRAMPASSVMVAARPCDASR